MVSVHSITLHPLAPAKPAWGVQCNGCGVCCAAETCPAGRLLFRRRHGPCPALVWQESVGHYRCGLAAAPSNHLHWLPAPLAALAARLFLRWIAAGKGCDCDYTVMD